MQIITAQNLPSPARAQEPTRRSIRVGLVQHAWREDTAELLATLDGAIASAVRAGAKIVFLPELTLSPGFFHGPPAGVPAAAAEELLDGPTVSFAAAAATRHDVYVHASLYERADPDRLGDGLGFSTAVLVAPDGQLVARSRETHVPSGEDRYFRPGPAVEAHQVHPVEGLDLGLGLPTSWDAWYPEVSRSYGIAGADVVVYPSAIASRPDSPGFDTQPLWQQIVLGQAIANGLFMIVPNRTGVEGDIGFCGSSFIADPYGRVLAQAPRDEEAVLVADLDLDQRRDWLTLFPFFRTRRPDTYGALL